MKFVLAMGALWPFVLAAGLLAAMVAGVDVSDSMAHGTLSATILGIPAVGVALYRCLPTGWSEGWRIAVACLLTPPLFAAEVFLALLLLVVGMYCLGFVPA